MGSGSGLGSGGEKAGAMGPGLWSRLESADALWSSRGVLPGLSGWWAGVLRGWIVGEARGLVARVGRRGGKSTSLSKWCVVNACYGVHDVPRADLGVHAIVSVRRQDALERLRTCSVLLAALGWHEVRYDKGGLQRGEFVSRLGTGQTELLIGTEFGTRVIRAYTASIAGVSGMTCIGVLCDEVSKWVDLDTG